MTQKPADLLTIVGCGVSTYEFGFHHFFLFDNQTPMSAIRFIVDYSVLAQNE